MKVASKVASFTDVKDEGSIPKYRNTPPLKIKISWKNI